MFNLVNKDFFNHFISGVILINTIMMASEYYGMEKDHETVLYIANIVVLVIFLIEMIIKIMGLGFKGYVAYRFNIFDGTMVFLGIADIVFINDSDNNSNYGAIIVLRAFRLLRIFKLARRWKSLKLLLQKMMKSLSEISYLGLLCLLCMFIYSLIGMMIFGKNLRDEDG